mmetsp:Transcript_28760/g.61100  ORF Transcript_28760/g.61100 Transcript_28760/m.61100 type:complete len:213 (+) Transcript_28760:3427-4065(+)
MPSAIRRSKVRASVSMAFSVCLFASRTSLDKRSESCSQDSCAFSNAAPIRPTCTSVFCCSLRRTSCSLPRALSIAMTRPKRASWPCDSRVSTSCLSSSRCACCTVCNCAAILSFVSRICCKEAIDVLHSISTPWCSSQSSRAAASAASCTPATRWVQADSTSWQRCEHWSPVLRSCSRKASSSVRMESKPGSMAARRACRFIVWSWICCCRL